MGIKKVEIEKVLTKDEIRTLEQAIERAIEDINDYIANDATINDAMEHAILMAFMIGHSFLASQLYEMPLDKGIDYVRRLCTDNEE